MNPISHPIGVQELSTFHPWLESIMSRSGTFDMLWASAGQRLLTQHLAQILFLLCAAEEFWLLGEGIQGQGDTCIQNHQLKEEKTKKDWKMSMTEKNVYLCYLWSRKLFSQFLALTMQNINFMLHYGFAYLIFTVIYIEGENNISC